MNEVFCKKRGILSNIMRAIQECMAPVIPMIMAGGLIKVLIILLSISKLIDESSTTFGILNAIGDAPYYFLPFEVAISAAVYFGIPLVLSVATVSVMFIPKFIELFSQNVTFIGIEVTNINYSYSVLPIILLVWIMSLIYTFLEKKMNKNLFGFFGNTIVLLISSLLAIIVIGPLGNFIALMIRNFVIYIQSISNIAASIIFSVLFSFLNMLGMQWPLIVDAISIVGKDGYETLVIISLLCVNISQGGACIASAIKISDKTLKSETIGMAITALISGASEPATYSNFALKKPMIGALFGSGIAGFLQVFLKLKHSLLYRLHLQQFLFL